MPLTRNFTVQSNIEVKRGDVVRVSLNAIVGSEQGGERPADSFAKLHQPKTSCRHYRGHYEQEN